MKIWITQRTRPGMKEAFLLPGALAAVLALLIILEKWIQNGAF